MRDSAKERQAEEKRRMTVIEEMNEAHGGAATYSEVDYY